MQINEREKAIGSLGSSTWRKDEYCKTMTHDILLT
jgi:hypothetical protein